MARGREARRLLPKQSSARAATAAAAGTDSSSGSGSGIGSGNRSMSQQPQRTVEVTAMDTYGATSVHTITMPTHTSISTYGAMHSVKRQKSGSMGSAGSSAAATAASLKLSNWQTSFHLISFMAGSGLLCLPLALVEIDWCGLLLLMVAAIVSAYTSKLLTEALDVVRWSSGTQVSYSDLGYECFGRFGQYLTAILVHACFIISCTGYLGIASSCIAGITGLQTGTVLVLLSITVWFHVFIKSLKSLAVFSAVNVAIAFWIEAIIFGDAMYPLKQITLETSAFVLDTPDLSDASMAIKLAYSFSLLSSGFFCHAIIPTFYNTMEDHRQCSTIVSRNQLGVMTTLYLPICIITYAVYGATLQAPVFFNMRNAFVRNLAIVLYTIHLLLSYTVTLFPMQQMFENCLLRMPCGAIPTMQVLVQDDLSGGASSTQLELLIKLVCRTVLVLLTLFLAYFFTPSTLDVFAYMIVPTTMLSLVFPSIFYWKLCSVDAGYLDKLANGVVLVLAVASMCGSLTVVI
ncbi:TPA: hypothetical protein N0F65_004738 [Lagenidium giganteum]|uniref:Amino acid transporter transmembrane domain-containing protein n=1 Tax=Lagenidium giganteum TaxID=4803 RepID=A0AAV2YK24_9STRA|nr:TPA: hypothetical protein N0F65_004738 [Lagenidium giganteum]